MEIGRIEDSLSRISMLQKCMTDAKKYIYREAFKEKCLDTPECLVSDDDPEWVKSAITGYLTKLDRGWKYMFVTINLLEDIHIDTILRQCEKCVTKVWIRKFLYCIEQRGETIEDIHGLHVHMLLELFPGKRTGRCKGEIYNTFKHLVGNRLCVNARFSMNCTNFVKYIFGEKSEDKMAKVLIDRKMRKKLGIENVYGHRGDFE